MITLPAFNETLPVVFTCRNEMKSQMAGVKSSLQKGRLVVAASIQAACH